jgi:hypothetical protein
MAIFKSFQARTSGDGLIPRNAAGRRKKPEKSRRLQAFHVSYPAHRRPALYLRYYAAH